MKLVRKYHTLAVLSCINVLRFIHCVLLYLILLPLSLFIHVVLDFGASGDGTTDNVNPFQNALNAAKAGGLGNKVTKVF